MPEPSAHTHAPRRSPGAFSLLEMAVILAVVSLLAATAILAVRDAVAKSEVRKTQEALWLYLQKVRETHLKLNLPNSGCLMLIRYTGPPGFLPGEIEWRSLPDCTSIFTSVAGEFAYFNVDHTGYLSTWSVPTYNYHVTWTDLFPPAGTNTFCLDGQMRPCDCANPDIKSASAYRVTFTIQAGPVTDTARFWFEPDGTIRPSFPVETQASDKPRLSDVGWTSTQNPTPGEAPGKPRVNPAGLLQ